MERNIYILVRYEGNRSIEIIGSFDNLNDANEHKVEYENKIAEGYNDKYYIKPIIEIEKIPLNKLIEDYNDYITL